MVEFGCQKYKDKIADLEDELDRSKQSLQATNQLLDAWRLDYKNLKYQASLNASLAKIQLTRALKNSIHVPDITDYVQTKTKYDPWIDPRVNEFQYKVADNFYYVYPKEEWDKILCLCNESVQDAQKTWLSEIGDCDNWAEAMHYIVQNATLKVKPTMYHQSAILVAWSWRDAHAYNAYVADEGIFIYEPQNGKTIGELGETESPYSTDFLLFLS